MEVVQINITPTVQDVQINIIGGGGGGSSVWGGITGTLSNQIDLQIALNAKQNLITTGTTSQYLRGDLSLATFPTNLSQFTNDVGFITNVITALGYTPENVVNKQTDLTSSATKYPTVNAVNTGLALKVTANSAIIGATKTKITYDSKGLVTGGVDASLSELLDDATHRTVTDAQIAAWNALIGGSVFQTVWNATTNSPSLVSSVGTKGFYYIVNVSGSTNLNGIIDWKVGDWAIYDGTVWRKVDNTDAVSDVNGLTGSVTLDTSNISATLNKRYVTDANLVVIGNTSGVNTGDNAVNSLYSGLASSKQDTLVSATNIKTINSTSLLGSGDIVITPGISYTFSTGLTNTSNTITNNLLTGISGGQTVIGGTGSGNGLTFSSTSNPTKGKITAGALVVDENTGFSGFGVAVPIAKLQVVSSLNTGTMLDLGANNTASILTFAYNSGAVNITSSPYGTLTIATKSNNHIALMPNGTGRVGIGTATPNASAKLEVTSTTQGFRLTPMTSTQASAITVAEGLMLFTSDTNGTFTSIGLWCYENGAWSKK